MEKNSEYLNKLITILASWEESDRKLLYDYWIGLWGEEETSNATKDHLPRGKAVKSTSDKRSAKQGAPQDPSAPKASTGSEEKDTKEASVHTAATREGKDKDVTRQFWLPLLGNPYAPDMVKDHGLEGKTVTQTKSMGKVAEKKR